MKAWRTVTFAGLKRSLLLAPAAAQAGAVEIGDIGVPAEEARRGITTWRLEVADVRPSFPPRDLDAHKGRFGHLLVVAGSLGKTGAAALAGRAALRSGVGLCTLAAPASQQPILAAQAPEYMTEAARASAKSFARGEGRPPGAARRLTRSLSPRSLARSRGAGLRGC